MRAPGIVIQFFGFLVLGGGIIGYATAGGMASLIAGSVFGLGLLASGLGVSKGKKLGFLFAPSLTLLLIGVLGYRSVQTGEFIPSGLVAVLGLVALLLYFVLRR